jgi:hypothetical protein
MTKQRESLDCEELQRSVEKVLADENQFWTNDVKSLGHSPGYVTACDTR